MSEDELPGGSFDACVATMQDDGHDEASATDICGALLDESKSEHGNVDELRAALDAGRGLIADVGVELLSGVDVPAIDSKWTMMKSDGDDHDYRVNSPVLLAKDADEDKRISYAAAMIPREPDKEGDVVGTAAVEKAAHDFVKQGGGVDTDHSLIDGEGEVVESWVLKQDRTFDTPDGGEETYSAGTWMTGIEWGQDAWERVKSGELTGLSIYGRAEHVELERSATTAKAFDVPLADQSIVHLVYESQTAATKASEAMGLGGDIHEHELDGMAVFMPGADHDAFVDRYAELAEDEAIDASALDAEDGDTHKEGAGKSEGMGSESTDDGTDPDGPTIDEVAASVEDLQETVSALKDTVAETDKQPGENLGQIIDDAAEQIAEASDTTSIAQAQDALKEAIAALDADDEGEVVESESDDDEDEETEEDYDKAADDVEKRTEEANVEKGTDARDTAADGIAEDTGGSGSIPSFREAAAEHGDL